MICQKFANPAAVVLLGGAFILSLGCIAGCEKSEQQAATPAAAATYARQPGLSRRRFLRRGAWALAGLGAASSVGLTALSERFVPQELAGYDTIATTLARIREAAQAQFHTGG